MSHWGNQNRKTRHLDKSFIKIIDESSQDTDKSVVRGNLWLYVYIQKIKD